MTVNVGTSYRLRVTAIGTSLKVYVDDMTTPKISVADGTYARGAHGVRVFNAAAAFDNTAIGPAAGSAVNLALGRPATGTTPCVASEGPDKAVNGSVSGGNSDKFCSAAAGAWLRVDLGSVRALGRFEVAHAQAGGEAASLNTRAYTITVSSDGVNWTQAVAVSNNTEANTAHTVSGVSGRYVRLNVSAPTQNSGGATRIYELRVFT
jgi:hypothetical protein